METVKFLASTCRLCQYYQPDGRRGGRCELLSGVPVQGSWQACALSIPAFTPDWEPEEVMIMPAHGLLSQRQNCIPLNQKGSTSVLNAPKTRSSYGNSTKIA